jgi:hypothetical protein
MVLMRGSRPMEYEKKINLPAMVLTVFATSWIGV